MKPYYKRINYYGILAWIATFILFFPILWMFMTSFKTEIAAVSTPPSLIFNPTGENYTAVQNRSDYWQFAFNSIYISFVGTFLSLLIAFPAAYAMAFFPTKRTKNLLVWMLSTKMLPPVGVLVPIYLITRDLGGLDRHWPLIIIYALGNLPIIIWMLYTFFSEIPKEILESVRMETSSVTKEFRYMVVPLSKPGIASTCLLSVILCWNEAFWSLNLTTSKAAPLTTFIASYSSPEGLFWAKLSAASVLAAAPIIIMGWFSQKQLVRGLSFGAVK
ncbi:MAG: carbohydrate ABC transporter permease [Alphaproteobacteria bacterium]